MPAVVVDRRKRGEITCVNVAWFQWGKELGLVIITTNDDELHSEIGVWA